MAVNVEIKARVRDPLVLEQVATRLGGGEPELLIQRDTFFEVPRGRLKLREISGGPAQLIQYERSDQAGPRPSDYLLVPVPDPTMLVEALDRSQGIRGIVRKLRKLWIVGQTRIHLDHVEELGDYVELEVVLHGDQSLAEGARMAEALMNELGICRSDLVESAYIDLLERRPESAAGDDTESET